MSEFDWSKKTKIEFRWVGLIGQKDQDQIQMSGFDW